VIRLDLSDFFTSIAAARVYGVFRTAGYPEHVAYTLTGLTTNVVPAEVWRDAPQPVGARQPQRRFLVGKRLGVPHLPQGAPTSPALANLCAHRLDRRLSGLAEGFGLRYGRYADDLAFSGSPSRAGTKRLIELADTIVAEEGFALNPTKTSVMTQGGRQRLTGMVVNRHPNLQRTEYEALRATLHNAVEKGLESQNREERPRFGEHLAGRVSWAAAVNPERSRALRQLLTEINAEQISPSEGGDTQPA
jgi:RNA-directed DNA polymerase